MRLPYLQIDGDFITQRARSVAALLGCSHVQAIGHLSLLWAWALSQGSDDAPPSGLITGPHALRLVRAAASWEGSAEEFVDVLCEPSIGLLERLPDGFRVRGLERYQKAWDKQRKDRDRKADVRRTSSGRPSDGAGKTQTQTQTQTQKEEPASQGEPPGPPSDLKACDTAARMAEAGDAAPGADEHPVDVSGEAEPLAAEERPPLELVAQEAGPKPRRQSKAEELYDGLQEHRRERCEKHGLPFIDERWPAQRKNRDLGPIARLLPGSEARERFVAAWNEFLDDERMGQLNVPWSLGYFLQSLPQWEGRALKAAGGGA